MTMGLLGFPEDIPVIMLLMSDDNDDEGMEVDEEKEKKKKMEIVVDSKERDLFLKKCGGDGYSGRRKEEKVIVERFERVVRIVVEILEVQKEIRLCGGGIL